MRKYFSKILIFILLVTILISSQIVFASVVIFNNDHLRFGNGSETSINGSGNLLQPFYFSEVYGWRQLTFSNYPLDFEIREGGDGTSWWNLNGTSLNNPVLSGYSLDSTGFTFYENGTKGYGALVTDGTVKINGKDIQINNKYELSQGKSFIKVTTKFTNKSESTVSNLRYWVGTRDDYVGGTDGPTKNKGNLIDGEFVTITNQSTPAKALRISTAEEGVLFYTDTDKANIVIGDSWGWTNVINKDPATSPITVTYDNSYAFYVRLNDLAPNASDEIVWYYAAGPLAELEEIVRDVASAAASVFNIQSETADFKTSSSVSGAVYYMVVPSNSTAPTATQIESGANYGGVTVKASGNGSLTAGVEKTFTISGLNAITSYDLYIVVKDNEGKYSSIAKNSFTTIKYSNTITFDQPAVKTYGNDQFLLNASADSDLPIIYTSSNTNVATVDADGRITITGVGTTNITASQGGNEYYEPATSVTRTLTVNKRPITVQATADTKVYDGTADSDEIPVITEGTLASGEIYVLSQKFDNKDASRNKTLIPSCKVFYQLDSETTPNYDITILPTSGEITLADPSINLENKTSNYTGNVISIEPASVTGVPGETPPGSIKYVYYTDRACTTLTTPTNSGASANGQAPVYAGTYYVKATIAATQNYTSQTTAAPGTLTITKAGQIDFGVGGIPQSVKYGDSFTVYPIGNINGTTTYKINSGNATVDTATGLVNINGIGEVVVEATNIAENFEIKTSIAKFTAQPKTITIKAVATNRPFEEGNNDVVIELITGVEGVTAAYSSASMVTADAGVDKVVTVTGITLNNANYEPESTTIYTKATIGKILFSDDLDITGLPSSITYEDDDFKLTATGQGTGEVIWSSSDRTVAKINSTTGVVTIKGAGTAVITATKVSDGNYESISSNITIEVDKKDVTYSIINNTKIYNGSVQYATIIPSAISLVKDEDYKVIYSQDSLEIDEPIEAGVYDIYIETLNDNYEGNSTGATLTILEANQTSPLVVGGLPNYIEYEDSFALYANGGNGEGNVNWAIESGNEYAEVTSGSGIVSITGVGTVTVSATKEGDGNYKKQVAAVTFTTNKKQINVVISNTLKTYNGLEQYVTIKATHTSYNTFENLTEISYVSQVDGGETEFKNVGTYNVLVDVNDDYSEYYELSGSLSAVASIKKADIIITADNKEKIYGEANPEFTMSYNLLGTDEKEIFEEPSITCVADGTSSVGEYDIVLSYEEENINSNYNVILSNGKLNVTPALLTVTADNKSVYYGRSAPIYTFSIAGFKGDDEISDLIGSPVFSCDYTKGSAEGEYDINVSGFTSSNYNFEYVPGKLTVLSPSSSGGSSGSGGTVKPVEPIVVENQYNNPFEDVNEDDWFYEAIECVNNKGLMSGTGITTFEPYLDTTRSMIVTILYRIEKEPDITKINSFNDIIIDSWYYDAIAWGAENGVVKGYDNETFGPNDKITREQLAAILYRYAMLKDYIVNESIDFSIYQDYKKISSWSIDSMKWAVSQGIITGTSPTTLDPQGYATRAQTAACLMRFMQNMSK